MVIRGLNIGVDAFNRWSFNNRGNLDGQWQLIDTWDADNIKMRDQFTPHENVYYLFGMLFRYMPKHARILKCEVSVGQAGNYQRVFAAAVKSNKNNFSIYLVNDDKNPYTVNLNLKNFNTSQLHQISVIESEHTDQTDLKITPTQVDLGSDGSISMKLPPFSFHVLSSYDLSPGEKGIVTDE